MHDYSRILSWAGFAFIAFALFAAPWMFGAWEMWWFWPFAILIFTATLLFALRLLLNPHSPTFPINPPPLSGLRRARHSPLTILIPYLVFLAYAFARLLQADVFMDAERSFLLFLTPFLIGIHILFGLSAGQRRALFVLILLNLFLLGLYGVVNHLLAGSRHVLWARGFPQYVEEQRATGSYFCPDHFSGLMELGLCVALALLLDRRSTPVWRVSGICLAALAVFGVVLSKSRGGGLTVLVIGIAALIWGLSQWPTAVRWYLRGAILIAGLALLTVFASSSVPYVSRFKKYFAWEELKQSSFAGQKAVLARKIMSSSRGKMISGALRAWKTRRVLGIGPGMHQNLWPHFAPSPDGDREKGIWPTAPNYKFHSYEVHSDWVQLAEEYGLAGLILFLVPVGFGFRVLVAGRPREADVQPPGACAPLHAAALAALLACVCMAFHSLGDFNLHIPATTWLLAALIALPIRGFAFRYAQNHNQ